MTLLQSILLGALQGLAEFLPISSSGHLQLVQTLFGLEEVPLLYDVFLHLATLLAVVIYFWPKIWTLLKCFGRWITKKPAAPETDDLLCGTDEAGRKTIIAIIISTIITAVLGVVTSKLIPEMPIKVVCAGFIVTSALLIISSLLEKHQKKAKALKSTEEVPVKKGISVIQSVVIGFMQGIGTLPGISRSGSTIAGALFSGVDRSIAGDYSFIVSIPAILGAFILELKDLGEVSSSIGAIPVIAGCIAAFIVGYISLALLMKIVRKGKLEWFAAYLIPVAILGFIFF
ncbi:MAG: undecaprenyl-diphosphate phosphatase [Treponema sp.]|nr:undecaprenyl-diphosphate phosphatase [Treponema sp.]